MPRPFFDQQCRILVQKGVSIETLEVPGRSHTGESRTLLDYIRFYPSVLRASFEDYDIVHANYGLTGPLALAQPHRPVVLSLWGSDLMGDLGWVGRYSARLSGEVIVMSEEMNAELNRDAHVIEHGVDFERFRPMSQSDAQREVGWNPLEKHVLFPYRPSRSVKNYPLAERVVTQADAELSEPVSLHAVYDVPHEKMPVYMNAADALLLTSRREGSPNSVKEAMACNLPVIATDVGDARKRLTEVSPGGVADTESELVARLTETLSSGKRSDGREAISDLSLDQMGERLLEVYKKAQDSNDQK
jgi:glycosyltransferase involved in cell wall biosynthesis